MNDLIFISYAHKNSDEVLPIIASLVEAGHNVWFDEGIEAGTEWPATIEKKLQQCTLMIAFISEASISSQNCRNEINYAVSLGKNILTVYLEDARLADGMNLQLGSLQAMFKYRHKSERSFINSILTSDMLLSLKEKSAPERYEHHGFGEHTAQVQAPETVSQLKDAKRFSTVKFGNYPSSGMTPTPIEWLVVEKQCGMALLISKYVIDCMAYGDSFAWGDSAVRGWLNSEFYDRAFSKTEKSYIFCSERSTKYSPLGRWIGTYDTEQQKTEEPVFLLDCDEVKRYFGGFAKRHLKGFPTPYAVRQGAAVKAKLTPWWLRSSHKVNTANMYGKDAPGLPPVTREYRVTPDIFLNTFTFDYNHIVIGSKAVSLLSAKTAKTAMESFGIRPAIWVSFG